MSEDPDPPEPPPPPGFTHFVLADPASGMVEQCAFSTMPFEVVDLVWERPPGRVLVQVDGPVDPRALCLAGAEVVPRSAMSPALSKNSIAADGVDAAVVSGLPDPCLVTVQGPLQATATVTGGTLSFTAAAEGTYRLTFTKDPSHLPWSCTVDVA